MLTESHEALAREVLIHGPIGRSALGRRLGLSPASLTRLAKPFLERGLFIELGEESTGAVGRPVRPLEIAPDLGCFTGVKITGDAAYAVLTDARAQILAERTLPLITTTPDAVVAVVASVVSDFSKPHRRRSWESASASEVPSTTRRPVVRAPFLDWWTSTSDRPSPQRPGSL